MKIKCTTLENEPGSVSNGVKCLREGSETITEQPPMRVGGTTPQPVSSITRTNVQCDALIEAIS